MSKYKFLFETQMSKGSLNKYCLYNEKNDYIFVDVFELDLYINDGWSAKPLTLEEIEEKNKVKIDNISTLGHIIEQPIQQKIEIEDEKFQEVCNSRDIDVRSEGQIKKERGRPKKINE